MNKILGSIIGGAIGDALGYQIEFERDIKEKECIRYYGKGIISDDTQMSLFSANALIWRDTNLRLNGISTSYEDAIYMGYLDWLNTQYYSKKNKNRISWLNDIRELNVQRDPGNTCLGSLLSGKKGSIEEPINNSRGCGGLMRVGPIGLYMGSPTEAGELAAKASAITHGHPLGIIPSYIFASMINILLNENTDIKGAYKKVTKQFRKHYDIFDKDNTDKFFNLVNKAIELSKKDLPDNKAIAQIGEGWVADEAFAIAIYSCFKYENSFEDAVICAINHDGDSDSTGSITGNLMGVYLGYDKINKYYVDNLELTDIMFEIANDIHDISYSKFDEYWISKYINHKRDLTLRKDKTKKINH